jgi:hypothetical protein
VQAPWFGHDGPSTSGITQTFFDRRTRQLHGQGRGELEPGDGPIIDRRGDHRTPIAACQGSRDVPEIGTAAKPEDLVAEAPFPRLVATGAGDGDLGTTVAATRTTRGYWAVTTTPVQTGQPLLRELIRIPEQIHQGDFVLRLTEGVQHIQSTLDSYVITPQLRVAQHHVVNTLQWPGLRPLQDAAVIPVLDGVDCLLLAPTAGGNDLDEVEAGRGGDQQVDLADVALVGDEGEVRPSLKRVAVRQQLAHVVQCGSFTRERRGGDLMPSAGVRLHRPPCMYPHRFVHDDLRAAFLLQQEGRVTPWRN